MWRIDFSCNKAQKCCCWLVDLLSVSHRSERRGWRALSVGELCSGGRPHRGLQTQTGSAGPGGRRNQTHPCFYLTGFSLIWLVCLSVRRRSSVWPSSPSRRNRDSLSAPLPRGSGAPSSSEPCAPPISHFHNSQPGSPSALKWGEGPAYCSWASQATNQVSMGGSAVLGHCSAPMREALPVSLVAALRRAPPLVILVSPDASDWFKLIGLKKVREDPGQVKLWGWSEISADVTTPALVGLVTHRIWPETWDQQQCSVPCHLQNVYLILFLFLCVSQTVLTGCGRC